MLFGRSVLVLPFLCSILLSCAAESSAKSWRGIEPLRSTRRDVIRLLNQCHEQKEACLFNLANESVYILFSGGLANEHSECAKKLPLETVMLIEVQPEQFPKLADMRLDKKRFKTFNPGASAQSGNKGYANNEEGLIIMVYNGRVVQLDYIAAAADRYLCPIYYQNPESFIEVAVVHIPHVYVTCPTTKLAAGENVVFSAQSYKISNRGAKWTVSAGKIIAGQNTFSITVDTTGLAGQTITVEAEVRDGFGHAAIGACEFQLLDERPKADSMQPLLFLEGAARYDVREPAMFKIPVPLKASRIKMEDRCTEN